MKQGAELHAIGSTLIVGRGHGRAVGAGHGPAMQRILDYFR